MQEIWVQSLGGEYPLKKEIATHSSTLAWKIPWAEEPGRLPVGQDLQDTGYANNFDFSLNSNDQIR